MRVRIPNALAVCFFVVISASAQPYEQEVCIPNRTAGIVLAGTLTTPPSPKAVCVLATGSGAQDRDETLLGHKPFKALADSLVAHGYAVLRMDDRGTGASGGNFIESTVDDFVTDIAAGVGYVDSLFRNIPVCVIGHSEGGGIAIRLGASDKRVDMIVTLVAPAWRGDSVIMSQGREIAMRMLGRWDGEALQRQLLDIAMSEASEPSVRMSLQYILMTLPEASIPQAREQLMASAAQMSTPYYRRMLRYDPIPDIEKVRCPWLALNGDRDVQVLCANLKTIAEHAPQADTVTMAGHNHIFQHSTTGMPDEYASLPEDISVETLSAITAWLDAHTASR